VVSPVRKFADLLGSMRPNNHGGRKFAEIHVYAGGLLRVSLAYASVRCVTDTMSFLEDGWVLWSRSVPGTTEGVRVYASLFAEEEGARGEIVGLAVYGRNLTAEKLRTIPLAHIETVANTNPEFRPHIAGTEQHSIGKTFDHVIQEANKVLMSEAYRKAQPRTPLTRPDGSDPDAFYEQVAVAYRDVVQTTPKVAKVLADEAGVPVGTVHRWVMEARRRGFLPPARQGRAG
jgi:hypothetical protein